VHGRSDDVGTVVADGIRTTTHLATTVDLCRVLPPAFALAQADAAVRVLHAMGHTVDLAAQGRAQANRRGVRQLDWVQERATAMAESVGESVSRAVIEWLGYEAPELQVEFRDDEGAMRADFYWRRVRRVGEFDGKVKYTRDEFTGGDPAEAVWREKKREDRIRRQCDGVIRILWEHVADPPRLARLLTEGGIPRGR
jgi:hypothetical protein